MEFLTDWGVVIALVCAGAAVVYGVLTSRWLLALSPGNAEMQRISHAVQEGATAYLRRQYTIIAGVAVVLAIVLAMLLEASDAEGILIAIGFLIGGTFSGAAGFIGMNVSVRANARVAESARSGVSQGARGGLQGRRGHGHARGRPGAARRGRLLRDPDPGRNRRARRDRRARGPRLRRLADLRLRPSGRRHLHQGRRRGRRPGRQDRGRHPRGRPAQPGGDRRQRGRQRGRLRRHGGRPVRDLRRHRGGGDAARRADLPGDRHGGHLPAGDRRRVADRLDHRHLRGPERGRQRRARALPGPDRVRRPGGAGLPADHARHDGRPHLPGRGLGPLARRLRRSSVGHRALPLHAGRHRRDRGPVRDHRLLHVHPLPARAHHRPRVADRARHEHHPGPRPGLPVHGRAGDPAGARHPRRQRAGRHLRHRRGGDGAAVADRPDRGARRLRPDHRQRRRHRRDGRPARGGAQRDRPARRGRQHHQGGHEGVRDRLRRAGRAGAVRRLRRGAARGGREGGRCRSPRSTSPSPRC